LTTQIERYGSAVSAAVNAAPASGSAEESMASADDGSLEIASHATASHC
jgi:hypothetical protein